MLTEQNTFEAAFDSGIGLVCIGEAQGDHGLINVGDVILDELVTEQPDAYMDMLRGRMSRLQGIIPPPEF